jgi:hypothetical protein
MKKSFQMQQFVAPSCLHSSKKDLDNALEGNPEDHNLVAVRV